MNLIRAIDAVIEEDFEKFWTLSNYLSQADFKDQELLGAVMLLDDFHFVKKYMTLISSPIQIKYSLFKHMIEFCPTESLEIIKPKISKIEIKDFPIIIALRLCNYDTLAFKIRKRIFKNLKVLLDIDPRIHTISRLLNSYITFEEYFDHVVKKAGSEQLIMLYKNQNEYLKRKIDKDMKYLNFKDEFDKKLKQLVNN